MVAGNVTQPLKQDDNNLSYRGFAGFTASSEQIPFARHGPSCAEGSVIIPWSMQFSLWLVQNMPQTLSVNNVLVAKVP